MRLRVAIFNHSITKYPTKSLLASLRKSGVTQIFGFSYFVFGLAAGGSWAQKPVVLPLSIQQVQRPPQCTVALHVVPQAPGKALASFFNCRAETVPIQRTAMMIVANEKFWMVFLMTVFLSFKAG